MSVVRMTACFVIVLTSSVWSQPPQRAATPKAGSFEIAFTINDHQAGWLQLVNEPAVLADLQGTEDQRMQLRLLYREMRGVLADIAGDQTQASLEVRRAGQVLLIQEYRRLDAEYKIKVHSVLDEKQLNRLQQIRWQASGPFALEDPELAKRLGLTEQQQQEFQRIKEEIDEEKRRLTRFAPDSNGRDQGVQDFQAALLRRAELLKERDQKLYGILTPPQQALYVGLLGEPFDLTTLRGIPVQRRITETKP
ncbi:hypothetical protein [Planctomicrobium sp. SH664]|uniref:hypothetical protein n=1 Tax=Planctomicrobium sp. SH664 TaxID=3448125 RepID=UPI003F5C9C48